jgi:hypothetical protein
MTTPWWVLLRTVSRAALPLVVVAALCEAGEDPDPLGILADRRKTETAIMRTYIAEVEMTRLDMTRAALETEVWQAQQTETAWAAAPAPQIVGPPAAVPPANQPPAPAPLAPSPSSASSPPVITRVDFPAGIPANGTKITGWVSFKDPDGDVNWMTLEVVKSKTMKGSAGDPREHMQGSPTDGRCWMQFWCYVKQEITMRATLFDAAGNQSNSMDFEFECQ